MGFRHLLSTRDPSNFHHRIALLSSSRCESEVINVQWRSIADIAIVQYLPSSPVILAIDRLGSGGSLSCIAAASNSALKVETDHTPRSFTMPEPIDTSVGVEKATNGSAFSPKPLRKTTTSSSSKSQSSNNRRNSLGQLVRTASTKIMEANPPGGMWSATGQLASRAPSFSELRGSGYSPITRRQQSQPLQSPPIQEHEQASIHADATSQTSIEDTPFMTPLQTPLAIVNSGWMDEPEEIEPPDEKKPSPPAPTDKAPSEHGSKSSDDTIHGDMGADEDLLPAISMMSQDDQPNSSNDTSKRNSTASKRKSLPSSEPGKRTSFISRLIKGKENEAPDALEEELSPAPKRRSKNLDHFFGEDTRKSRNSSALANHDDDDLKQRSKESDALAGDQLSKGVVPNRETRKTRDFADMVEGDEDDFPELLFGRDTMPTQSYDPSQKKAPAENTEKPVTETGAVKKLAKPEPVPNAKIQAAKARLAKDVQSEPPSMPLPAVEAAIENNRDKAISQPTSSGPSASAATGDHEEEVDEEEEDIDWDEFMREFDERPPRRTKGASKDVSKFFGEDANAIGGAAPTAEHDTSPLASDTDEGVSKTKSSRRQPNLYIQTDRNHATTSAKATQQPADALAGTELQVEKEAGGGSPDEEGVYPTGYRFPPKKTAWQGFVAGTKAFWGFFLTPLGFLVTIYGLLVVAWGGMLFLLLCNASPWMCTLGDGTYDCNAIDSPRRIWVEYDSQILNALFCVTGFGLIPWRFRDFYYLLKFRLQHSEYALRRLAGFHNGWFRLPASTEQPVPTQLTASRIDPAAADESNAAYPLPSSRAPLLPLTGYRAPPTPVWKLDFVVWAFVINTAFQACLSGFMWGLNRYDRPSWSTGLFVALACTIAAAGGYVQFVEGRKIKQVEGVPWENPKEMDREMGLEDVGTEVTPAEKKGKGENGMA